MKSYVFPCGCSWPILKEFDDPDIMPLLDFDVEQAPDDCPATWGLLSRGETKGVFQLESPLGKQWCKKLKPQNYEHIAALGALLRPGCLRAVDEDGVSMTQHYCRRKNGEEETEGYHPAIDAILFPTYHVLAYQEQAMAICVAVAGFTGQEADMLRKAIGKKLPEEMAKCKKMFLEGASKAGIISQEQAEEVFGWIEKSQRYSFNKSHAYCYGLTGYESAYIKAHFPLAFFTSWLLNARHKQDPQQEVFELVNDARLFDVTIDPPDLRSRQPLFHTDLKTVKFGLSSIKGVGVAQVDKLNQVVTSAEEQLHKKLADMSWWEFLVFCASRLPSNVVVCYIEAGAVRWTGLPRQVMRAEYLAFNNLTVKEQEWVSEHASEFTGLLPALRALGRPRKEGGGAATKNRVSLIQSQAELLEHPPTPLVDSPLWLADREEQLLGISLTCARIDSCDLSQVNCSCKEYLSGRTGFLVLGVEIQAVRLVKTKKGKTPGSKMAFLTVADNTCCLEDVVVFPDVWKEHGHLLREGDSVIIQGQRDGRGDNSGTLIVKKVWPAEQSSLSEE
jgi:DNA polymerase-3 subunit alpha